MAEFTAGRKEIARLEAMLKTRKGFLLYHSDSDGVCSAAMLQRFFKGFERSPMKGPIMSDEVISSILEKRPEALVFLDLPVDQEAEKLGRLLKAIPGMSIAIIDHHIAERDMNSEIAAMGTIGDYGWQGCPELMKQAREDFPGFMEGEPRKSRLGSGSDIIAAAATLKGLRGVGECLKHLDEAQGIEDFEEAQPLKEWKREMDEEFLAALDDFGKNRQEFRKEMLATYEVKSRVNLASMLSTRAGEAMADWTVAIRTRAGDLWKVSLRNQSGRVNLGDVVKRCAAGIGSGGGHEKAASAMVSDWDEFLTRLRKSLS